MAQEETFHTNRAFLHYVSCAAATEMTVGLLFSGEAETRDLRELFARRNAIAAGAYDREMADLLLYRGDVPLFVQRKVSDWIARSDLHQECFTLATLLTRATVRWCVAGLRLDVQRLLPQFAHMWSCSAGTVSLYALLASMEIRAGSLTRALTDESLTPAFTTGDHRALN